jgi:hypothetical protein
MRTATKTSTISNSAELDQDFALPFALLQTSRSSGLRPAGSAAASLITDADLERLSDATSGERGFSLLQSGEQAKARETLCFDRETSAKLGDL